MNKEVTTEELYAEMEDFVMSVFIACDEIQSCEQYLSDDAEAESFNPSTFKYDIADSIVRFIEQVYEEYDSIVDFLQNCTVKDDDKSLEQDELILRLIEKNIQAMSIPRETAIIKLVERVLS